MIDELNLTDVKQRMHHTKKPADCMNLQAFLFSYPFRCLRLANTVKLMDAPSAIRHTHKAGFA